MRRGEVWWAELPSQLKSRPVVILTRDQVVESIDRIVVCIVTRTERGLQSEVRLGRLEGLPVVSVVNLDNLLTVDRRRLGRKLGQLNATKARELDAAIRFALQIE